jgi:hypothetical protein
MPMKPSSPKPHRQAVSRATARNAALVNQLATPGLGSLMAGRWLAGSGQLALALAGFVMIVTWFIEVMIQFYGQINSNLQPRPVGWLGETGAILFAAAWLWALVTSVSLLLRAKAAEADATKPVPPRMADLPGQPPEPS